MTQNVQNRAENSTLLHEEITSVIIESFYIVYKKLGFGFLERVYQNALAIELRKKELDVECQKPLNVLYDGVVVGDFFADFVINSKVIVEIKAAERLIKEHEYQLINYLKATEAEVGLLLNFGKEPEFKRKIFTNDRKTL
ncbi:MAG: GxxExxY protein [Ignavibacteria bacterium]